MECEPSTSQYQSSPASSSRKRKSNDLPNLNPKLPRNDNNTTYVNNTTDESKTAGKIIKIFLRNFMCHESFHIEFNRKVNFVVGKNGSGKSAILTALIIGLGAKAVITKRGGKISDFIKTGKSSATIEITIGNEGPMAYKQDFYGSSITVIRNISDTTSAYIIKNSRGEIKSKQKKDLEKILKYLNIQVDNPISVLNQDASRDFLKDSSPSNKYEFFMEATRLREIGNNYKKAVVLSEEAKKELDENNMYLEKLNKDIKNLKKKLQAIESLDGVKLERENLTQELKWAEVIEEEKKLLNINLKIQAQEKKTEEYKNSEILKIAKEKEIDEEKKLIEQQKIEIEKESTESSNVLQKIQTEYLDKKKIYDNLKTQARQSHESINRELKNITDLKNYIKSAKNDYTKFGFNNRQEAQEALKELQDKFDEFEDVLKTKRNDLTILEENKNHLVREKTHYSNEVENRNDSIGILKNRLNSMLSKPHDSYMVYGPNISKLLQRIDEEFKKKKFDMKPKGPIGAFIKVKDPNWIPAIECQNWHLLTSFCVNSTKDAKVFNLILNEVFYKQPKPQVIISRFINKLHDVSEKCTISSTHKNLFDLMEISDPVITNCVIDQIAPECTLLIDTSHEASKIMSSDHLVPKNCKKAFTKRGDLFYPVPCYRTYGGKAGKPRYLQVSTNDAIRDIKDEIRQLIEERDTWNQKLDDIKRNINDNGLEVGKVKNEINELFFNQQKLGEKIDSLKENLDLMTDGYLESCEMDVRDLEKKVEEERKKEKDFNEQIKKLEKELDSLSKEVKHHKNLIRNKDYTLESLDDKIRELDEKKKNLNVSNQGINKLINANNLKLQQFQSEYEQQQRVVSKIVKDAEKICQRIESDKSIDVLKTKIQEINGLIASIEREHGSEEEIRSKLIEKEEKHTATKDNSVVLEKSNTKQLNRLIKRKETYRELKRIIAQKVQNSFDNFLSLRNYKGKIKIDHKNKTLNMEVNQKNEEKRVSKDVKSLSGGESSFSTVALLMALWDFSELPFYFLDECDIFCDGVNRKLIIDILINYGKTHPKKQFAFLSPLGASFKSDDNLQVHKLNEPERS